MYFYLIVSFIFPNPFRIAYKLNLHCRQNRNTTVHKRNSLYQTYYSSLYAEC